jgi:hypothetical protein
MKNKRTDPHREYCLANAVLFTAIRGRNPRSRTRAEFSNIEDAKAYAANFGDKRTMIYAVTEKGEADHVMNG